MLAVVQYFNVLVPLYVVSHSRKSKRIIWFSGAWRDGAEQAVIENIELKQKIFADLEKSCRKDCILATNTSTIDLNLVGSKTRSQDRLIGAHFFRS